MDSPQVLRAGTRLTTEDQEGVRTPRRVLVTGANRGLGLEIVKALLERQDVDKVYLGCRDFAAGTALCCGELWDLGGDRSEAVELDVSDGESIKQAVNYVRKTLAARDDGHVQRSQEYVDAVVNNAGIFLDAEADIYRKSAAARTSLAVNFEGAVNVTTAFLPLLADDATVVNVSSRQAARTLGFLEPRHRDVFEANDIEAVRRAAYEVADLLDDDYGPYTTLATPAHGLSKCALNAWTRIMAQRRPEMRFLAVAPGQLRTRHNPVVWEGGLRPRPPRLGARVVVDALYGAHASGSFLAQTCASDGTRFLRGEYETHDDSWASSATHVVDWVVEPPAAIGPGTSAPVDSHGRTGSLRRSQELLPREY